MELQVHISRPFSLLMIVGVAAFGLSMMMSDGSMQADLIGQGGSDTPPQLVIHTAEDEVRRIRLESELAERHIEVLKYQLKRLEQEREFMGSDLTPELNEQFRAGLRSLVELIEGKRRADAKMVESFQQMWDARRAGLAAATLSDNEPAIFIEWPIDPVFGISAIFNDSEYEKFFGMPHKAVDIPALQGSYVLAADGGVVEEVVDNGLGYSYLTIRHEGYVTLYGHISESLMEVGDRVLQGDPIAKSGGMPGTNGAGHLSTGPHVHFEVITGLGQINPLKFLSAAGVTLRK